MIHHILSAIIFFPLLGAALILILPRKEKQLQNYVALATCLITFVLTGILIAHFNPDTIGIQFLENQSWISSLKISYLIGVDGLSVVFLPLTALLFLLGVVASWNHKSGTKGYLSLFLILETSVLGTFSAQDLFLFFAFWTSSLLPIYFMIGVWGGETREYAATKFFLFQLAGGAFLLLGMLAVYYTAEPNQFGLQELAGGKFSGLKLTLGDRSISLENLLFVLMLIGFAVRLPIVPLHSWFAHAQAEAPAALAVILAAVFIKTGAYAIVRVNYALFPSAASWFAPVLSGAGVVNIIYGAICALGQKDIRRLVAYSCVSHMGFVLLGFGIFSTTAFHGALLQMIAHGVYGALLCFLIGVLGDRSGYYEIVDQNGNAGFGGLVSKAPLLTGFFTVAVFSALGTPGLGAFASEALVFLGAFSSHHVLTVIGLIGVLLTAGYLLWMSRRMFLGPVGKRSESVSDVTLREQLFIVPLIVLCLVVGTYPTPFMNLAQPTINQLLTALGKLPR